MRRPRLTSVLAVTSLIGATLAGAVAATPASAAGSSYEVRPAATGPVQQQGETFFTSTFYLTTGGGAITLAGSSDGSAPFFVDDVMNIAVTEPGGTSTSYSVDDSGGFPACPGITPTAATPLTADFAPGVNKVVVTMHDECGGSEGSSDIYLSGDVSVSATPPTPTLGVTLHDDSTGSARTGQIVNYTASPSVSVSPETGTVTLSDTFPSDLVPQASGLGGAGWSCAVGGQTVLCTDTATPSAPAGLFGPLPSVVMPVKVSVAAGAAPESLQDTVTVGASDAQPVSASDTQTYSGPAATALTFITQPVDAQVNAAMTGAGGTTHIQVGADIGAAGPVDPTYTGAVTLGFGQNPGGGKFVVGGQPVSTITVAAVNGVADFSPIIINAVGVGYTLTASASVGTATSSSFTVASGAAVCPANQSCTTTATSAPAAGESASVTGLAAGNSTIITASFGGNVAPLHPCNSAIAGVLTFNGARQKVVSLTIATRLPILIFCYGQPTPFLDLTLHKTTFFSHANQEYEGVLAPCIKGLIPPPCISGLSLSRTSETVTVTGGPGDPRISH
jgi:hypothetical protein